MTISCWDEDTGADDKIGEATIKISALTGQGNGINEWFEIQHKGRKAGTINLSAKYTDYTKQAKSAAVAGGAAAYAQPQYA